MNFNPTRDPRDPDKWIFCIADDLESPVGHGATPTEAWRDCMEQLLDKRPQPGRAVLDPAERTARAELVTQLMDGFPLVEYWTHLLEETL